MVRQKKTNRSAKRRDIHQEVTDRIIEIMETGTKPWVHPWLKAGQGAAFPLRHNGEKYRGMNVLLLWATAMEKGYRSPFWMTFKQALEYGACVRKGERGTMVIKYGTVLKDEDGATVKVGQGDDEARRIGYLRSYTVFNAQQIDGLAPSFYPPENDDASEPVAAPILDLETYFGGVGAKIETTETNPCYVPALDVIRMPPIGQFTSSIEYYSTLSHELVHWCSVPRRLDIESKMKGRAAYSFNELTAELASVFIMGNLGIVPDIENSAAYLKSWLAGLRDDKKFIFEAASLAQRAADYIDERATPIATNSPELSNDDDMQEALSHSDECVAAQWAA